MRVRVIRWTDPTSSQVNLAVQRWCAGHWEFVEKFALYESEKANEFAMKLSMSKRDPIEMAVFENGEKLSRVPLAPLTMEPISGSCDPKDADHSYNSIRTSSES